HSPREALTAPFPAPTWAISGRTRAIRAANGRRCRAQRLTPGYAHVDRRSSQLNRLFAVERKTDLDPSRSSPLSLHGQWPTDLLPGSGHPLDRNPTTRRTDKVSLFKRGDVWWSYFYRDGIRHQYSTGASNRRQAETIEAKLKEEVNNKRFQIVQ